MFSIIDIETTGGNAKNDKITEIAVYVHDGKEVVKEYQSLVNPERPIPYFISSLTGIDDAMVKNSTAEDATDDAPCTTGTAGAPLLSSWRHGRNQGSCFMSHGANLCSHF